MTFGYSGAQCIKNKITIYNNETSVTVYENTISSFNLAHSIPVNTLSNGTSYNCVITAYYMEGTVEKSIVSSVSNVFKCLATPVWSFNGLTTDMVIGNSYYDFQITYSQAQNETVDEYRIALYTSSGSVFWESEILYNTTAVTRVTNLPNDTILYARAFGTTTNGLRLDTRGSDGNDIPVNISYIAPKLYSLAYLKNNKWQGTIEVETKVSSIEGRTSSGNNAIFINNEYVNLKNDSVIFDTNFIIPQNFVLQGKSYDIAINKPFLKIIGTGLEVIITFRQAVFNDGEKVFAELKIANSDYVIYSDGIAVPSSTDLIHLWVQRNNGLYKIKIENLGVVS